MGYRWKRVGGNGFLRRRDQLSDGQPDEMSLMARYRHERTTFREGFPDETFIGNKLLC